MRVQPIIHCEFIENSQHIDFPIISINLFLSLNISNLLHCTLLSTPLPVSSPLHTL